MKKLYHFIQNLFYINLIAFIFCIVVMIEQPVNSGRFVLLLLLAIINLGVFISSLRKKLWNQDKCKKVN